ncbi:MAG: phosphatidate cytidylyltransferase [Acidimicrobiia bacterium]|nr:phosphatidate cytidylyltransferase [Acidimicrobiia bacterium]
MAGREEEGQAAGREADVVPLPGMPERDESDIDWGGLADSDDVEDFTSEEYLTATTQEYRGLAEDITRAASEKWEQQAVAATLPGVGSGLVSFDDVSGAVTPSEESYEADEQAATSDLAMRVASAVGIFGMFLGTLFLPRWWFTAFLILVMVVSLGELYATMRTGGFRPVALFGLLGVVAIGVGVHNGGPYAMGVWVGVTALAVVLFFALSPRRDPLTSASVTLVGMVWVGLLAFAIPFTAGPHPLEHILFFVLVVALNDTGGYFVGRSVGKRRLAKEVSPGKTVEGFFGGLILGAVAASIMAVVPPWLDKITLSQALVAAGVIGLFAPLGDLAESAVKRSLGVKDMGSVLPGHGGMLDRIDGFLFAAPAVYLLFRGFGLL